MKADEVPQARTRSLLEVRKRLSRNNGSEKTNKKQERAIAREFAQLRVAALDAARKEQKQCSASSMRLL